MSKIVISEIENSVSLEKLIDAAQTTVTAAIKPYGKMVTIETKNNNLFLFSTLIRIKNIGGNGGLTCSGYMNLQESDNITGPFKNIPADRLNTKNAEFNFSEDPHIPSDGFVTNYMDIEGYSNKKYVRVISYIEYSRSIETNECYIASYYIGENEIYNPEKYK